MSITIERNVSRDALVKPESLNGYTFTGEAGAHVFVITATLRGEEQPIAGTITGSFLRADNEVVDLNGTVIDGKAQVSLSYECYDVPGRFLLTIYRSDTGESEAIYSAVGTVLRADSETHVDTGIIPTFASLTAAQEAAEDAADRANDAAEAVEADVSELKSQVSINASDDYSALSFSVLDSGKYINYQNGTTSTASMYNSTGYIPVGMLTAIKYKRCGTSAASTLSGIAFFNASKQFISGVPSAFSQAQTGYISELQMVGIPTGAAYVRCSMYSDTTTYGSFAIYGVTQMVQTVRTLKPDGFVDIPFIIANNGKYIVYSDGTTGSHETYGATDYINVEGFGKISYKRNGTTYSDTSAGIAFYNANKQYISGVKGATSQSAVGYVSTLYTVDVPTDAKYARFTTYADRITYGFFELYAQNKAAVEIDELQGALALVDGSQWRGKVWYGYGTSITNTDSEGRYPTYLAQMSGLTYVNKGISGGGIGDLGGYAHGQVYNAICNITDGKLSADLITLETGANDVRAEVPLGTIYDTGRTTLAGCLNDCIRYLQANTDAQICIINSPASTTAPSAANKYYEWADMVRQICDINRVHFLNNNSNMGYAKVSDATKGPLYVVDTLHQTNLGGFIMAQNLWYQLRNVPLFYTAIPT